MNPLTKAEWRRHVREQPTAPTSAETRDLHRNLLTALADTPGLILIYRAMPSEIPIEPVADELGWGRCAVTRTPDTGPLSIHPAIGAMEQHRFGFSQPVEGSLELPPHHISAAIVPGLAFDRSGTRLGRGAGYYDELLAKLPADRPRIGITIDRFLVDSLPAEPHDVRMTQLVTEHEILDLT